MSAPKMEHDCAKKMHAIAIEMDRSHVPFMSQPAAVKQK